MNDLLDHLAGLRADAPAPTDADIAGDLRRGRRALARRRTVRAATTGAFALAVGGVTTAVVASSHQTHHDAPASTRLVDYTGKQLPGFTIAKVPAGFVLQGVSASVLDIARPDDTSSLDDFQGKIVVTVEDTAAPHGGPAGPQWSYKERMRVSRKGYGALHYTCPDGSTGTIYVKKGTRAIRQPCSNTSPRQPETSGRPIAVDGAAGTITTNSEGTKYFKYRAGDRTVTVQVWPTIHLTDDQLRELASGITVTATAQLSHG